MQDLHRDHAGFTEGILNRHRLPDGRTSYDVAADAAGKLAGRSVVDLACGSGPLTARLARRVGPDGLVVGIDVSPAEIALARQRVTAPQVRWECCGAQALPLADRSVDAVVCHLALMAMRPLDAVVAEAARVLAPGGLLVAVVGGTGGGGGMHESFCDLLDRRLVESAPGLDPAGISDPRVLSQDGLTTLLSADAGFAGPPQLRHFDVPFVGPAATVARDVVAFWYTAYLLSTTARRALTTDLRELLEAQPSAAGATSFLLPQTVVTVRTRRN